jgi:perosamine synthetase
VGKYLQVFFSPLPRQVFYGGLRHILRGIALVLWSRWSSGRSAEERGLVDCVEQRLARFLSAKNAVLVPQARFGIYLAIKQSIRPGDKVILSPYTIADVVNMVICAGGIPMFVDIQRSTCGLNIDLLYDAVTDDVSVIMFTHFYGYAQNISELATFCRENRITLIEDCAQVFGASIDAAPIGSQGDIGVFSFGRAKNLNAFYGGLIVTTDAKLATAVRHSLSSLPIESRKKLISRLLQCLLFTLATVRPVFQLLTFSAFQFLVKRNVSAMTKTVQTEEMVELKERIPNSYCVQISIPQVKMIDRRLDYCDEDTGKRIHAASLYFKGLQGIDDLLLPPLCTDGSNIYLSFPIQYQDRWALTQYLVKHRRDVAIAHIKNAADLEIFRKYATHCPVANSVAKSLILLPTYPGYSEDEILKNIQCIRRYFNK